MEEKRPGSAAARGGKMRFSGRGVGSAPLGSSAGGRARPGGRKANEASFGFSVGVFCDASLADAAGRSGRLAPRAWRPDPRRAKASTRFSDGWTPAEVGSAAGKTGLAARAIGGAGSTRAVGAGFVEEAAGSVAAARAEGAALSGVARAGVGAAVAGAARNCVGATVSGAARAGAGAAISGGAAPAVAVQGRRGARTTVRAVGVAKGVRRIDRGKDTGVTRFSNREATGGAGRSG
jgi:hypothetical protein